MIVKAPRFALHTRGGRLASDGECDRRIERRLDDLSAAHNWSRLRIGGDGGGIAVTWRFPSAWSQTRPQWPCHVWLAEQLADSLGL